MGVLWRGQSAAWASCGAEYAGGAGHAKDAGHVKSAEYPTGAEHPMTRACYGAMDATSAEHRQAFTARSLSGAEHAKGAGTLHKLSKLILVRIR